MAIAHALRVIGWEENLGEGEMPPEWMWPFPDELKLWFEDVKASRDEKYGGGDDSDDGLVDNEMYPSARRGRR